MIPALSTALSGMLAQQTRLAVSASNIANASTPDYRAQRTELTAGPAGGVTTTVVASDGDVDFGSEMVETIEASLSFSANAKVFETGADLWDVLMSINRDQT